MDAACVLTLNAGSSSIKFALFRARPGWPERFASGAVEGLGAAPRFSARRGGGGAETRDLGCADHESAMQAILGWINAAFPDIRLAAVGHRVVHGGLDFCAPIAIDDVVLNALWTLAPLAPLHQPHNLKGVEAARAAFANTPQIACFDTAFHRGHAFAHEAYALPRAYYDRGLRRFGFHGLSYEYIARRMREIAPVVACGRMIVAHLGNGDSLCALRDGRSVATTMGFSALDGAPMGTRCGEIDPGLLLYLLQHDGMTPDQLSKLLYESSGLKGLSGVSQDMRALEASDAPSARQAIDYFTTRVRMEIGALAAALSGVDALVFTGGVGEHSPRIRRDILKELGWLGAALDDAANEAGALELATAHSRVKLYALATNEEAMIAEHAIDAAGVARA